jgi:hypothetical protein
MKLSAEPTALDEAWRAEEARLGKRMVVFLDQVEEVFTRPDPAQPRELDEFLTGLVAILSNRETRPQGKLVLGFRKEWLAELDRRLAEVKLLRTPVFLKPIDQPVVIPTNQGGIRSLAFTRDGRLVTGGSDGSAKVWHIDLNNLIKMAEQIAGRNLSLSEWQQFFGKEPYRRTFPDLPDGAGVAEAHEAR